MGFAFVTLVTSDAYLPGALVVTSALRDVHPTPTEPPEVEFQTVCLVTPETVDVKTIKLLRRAFDVVVGVEVISTDTSIGLDLLGRPDLHTVLTKLHAFRLTQYDKIIFLDADVLPLRPMSHLLTLPHEFAAVPDVGWPDIFNSGVMVFSPGEEKFNEIMGLVQSKGSWDGGDQGVLNEWRGDNWHRLSFTYNTTPTAAYTYAPAYERFGNKISAIHFIGPNKPWASIPFRAPASQASHPSSSAQQSYAYSALVDRWFDVYDTHFRPTEVAPHQEYEIQRYKSAWNESTESLAPNTVLNLDDLRRLAIEGVAASSIVGQAPSAVGEGEYQTLPLEGRVDLMRPPPPPVQPPAAPHVHVEGPTPPIASQPGPTDTGTHRHPSPGFPAQALPTPLPHEVPPAPLRRTHSFPPITPQAAVPVHPHQPPEYFAAPPAAEHHSCTSSPPRPPSPPKITWNPAVEPPPRTPPPPSHFPIDSYFPNVWDVPQPQPHRHQSEEEERARRDQQFFQPPARTHIPPHLVEQGHYRALTSDVKHPQPDRSSVATVFPWEERRRAAPQRYFPRTDTPPPGLPFVELTPKSTPEAAPASQATRQFSPTSSPPSHRASGMPLSMQYFNAWDHVPGIQKYAKRLMRPPAPPIALNAEPLPHKGHRRRHSEGYPVWEEVEESSRDGDVESDDELTDSGRSTLGDLESTDSQERSISSQTLTSPSVITSAPLLPAPTRPGTSIVPRSRRGSRTGTSGDKKYRSQSTQTIPKETRDRGVQAVRRKAKPPHLSPGALPPVPAEIQQLKVPASEAQMSSTPHGPAPGLPPPVSRNSGFPPSGTLSPRLHDSYAFGSLSYSPPMDDTRALSTPKPKVAAGARVSPPSGQPSKVASQQDPARVRPRLQTLPSEDVVLSPASSGTPTSPAGGAARRTGRVFDPTRGVDVFKRGSEEVLARFLRMDSWDESPPRKTASPL
ncbi:hypothetical protein AURDEDRAFT_111495 [Auricularia subglabra TFB-10046 SS5]|nr:hypothetical protein AURDEDRAFT_111495 [Auricularia subglabra TFB-10046 SS5]